jgi:hypothetical protein
MVYKSVLISAIVCVTKIYRTDTCPAFVYIQNLDLLDNSVVHYAIMFVIQKKFCFYFIFSL